jgi:hypothetical protein
VSCGGGAEQPSVKTFKAANQGYSTDDLYRFFAVAFGAAPGVTYMGQLIEAAEWGLSIKEIVNIFTTKPQFTDTYPVSMSNADFASKLVENVVGSSATSQAKQEAVNDIVSALSLPNWTRGDVIYAVFNNLAKKPESDAKWYGTAKKMANQVTYAKYYTEIMKGDSLEVSLLSKVIQDISSDTIIFQNINEIILSKINKNSLYFGEISDGLPDFRKYYEELGGFTFNTVSADIDINGDGLKDLVVHFWKRNISNQQGTTKNKLVIFIQQPGMKFIDKTENYLSGTSYLGGTSYVYTIADVNNDGKDDVIFAINQEDGRSTSDDFTAQIAILISGKEKYSISKVGEYRWYFNVATGYDANNKVFVMGGGSSGPVDSNSGGNIISYVSDSNWKDITKDYPPLDIEGQIFFNDNLTPTESTYLFQRGDGRYPIAVDGYYKNSKGEWTRYDPYIVESTGSVQWTSYQGVTQAMGTFDIDGIKYLSGAISDSCAFKYYPNSKPIPIFLLAAIIVPTDYDGKLPLIQTDLVNTNRLFGVQVLNGKIEHLKLNIDNQYNMRDSNYNMQCKDINGDGYMDIVQYPIDDLGSPLIYLNNKDGTLKYINRDVFPKSKTSSINKNSMMSLYSDLDNDGILDLIVWSSGFNAYADPGYKFNTKIYKGLNKLKSP